VPSWRKHRIFDDGLVNRLELRVAADGIVERARRLAEVVVERTEAGGAVALERDPEFEDVGAARTQEAARAEVHELVVLAPVK
jgi:hypothetical protein